MGIFKDIKYYFKKKAIVKSQLDHSIPNYNTLNKTIVFINGAMSTLDKDSGSNRLKEIILTYIELGHNCIICTKNAYRTDKYINYFSDLGIIIYVETNQYKNYFVFLKSVPKVDYVWYYSPNTLKNNLKKITNILPYSKIISLCNLIKFFTYYYYYYYYYYY
jgi:hypothetical protein